MTRETLLNLVNSSVRVMTDGEETLAILNADSQGTLTLTAHSPAHEGGDRPVIVHTLAEEEIHLIHLEGAVLVSSVALQTSTQHRPPPEMAAGPDSSIEPVQK